MNLFDLSSTNTNREKHAMLATGGWVGTLPDGYTTMVDGKKFTVRTCVSGTQVLTHELPGGDIRIHRNGRAKYYDMQNRLHRDDGPAEYHPDGTSYWYQHGKIHRDDGPAAIWRGDAFWYRHGQLHREDGPAVTRADGTEEYWLHGKRVNKEDLP